MVHFDDCQHSTGMMVDAKGPGYAKLLTYGWGRLSIGIKFATPSPSQVLAARDRPIRWYFAERETADFARALFSKLPYGDRIDVEWRPWPEQNQ